MAISLNTQAASGATAVGSYPDLQQIKTDLTAALIAAGVTDAKATDITPKGFPKGVSWPNAYSMVTYFKEDNNPATPGIVTLSPALLKTNLAATKTLSDLGYTDISSFPRGSSVQGAIDTLYRDQSNGILASVMARSGIYNLSAFPAGTTTFQAFKLIEDPNAPGKISNDNYKAYKAASAALKSMDITTLVNFPRGTTLLQAKDMVEPKADLMLNMSGIAKSNFNDPTISSLTALSIVAQLPDTIRQMKSLPTGANSSDLALQAAAAKKLVTLGYDNLTPFSSMKSFATETPKPTTAYAVVKKIPAPADLPLPTSANTERLFQSTAPQPAHSYGQPNLVTNGVYAYLPSEKVTTSTVMPFKIVSAADVLKYNQTFWAKK